MNWNNLLDAGLSYVGGALLLIAVPPDVAGMAIMAYPILGIPLAALAAAMLGSGFSYLRRQVKDTEAIPVRLVGIVADAVVGGWVALALFHATPLHGYGIKSVPIEAVAGLCAFAMQVIRTHALSYFDRAFQAGLNAWVGLISRKGTGPNEGEPQ